MAGRADEEVLAWERAASGEEPPLGGAGHETVTGSWLPPDRGRSGALLLEGRTQTSGW